MVNWITFSWQVEIVAVAIMIYGLFVFLRAIIKLDKNFRLALFFVLGSVLINLGLGIMIGVFLTKGVGQQTMLEFWVIRPLSTLLASVLLMIGARKFLKAIEQNK